MSRAFGRWYPPAVGALLLLWALLFPRVVAASGSWQVAHAFGFDDGLTGWQAYGGWGLCSEYYGAADCYQDQGMFYEFEGDGSEYRVCGLPVEEYVPALVGLRQGDVSLTVWGATGFVGVYGGYSVAEHCTTGVVVSGTAAVYVGFWQDPHWAEGMVTGLELQWRDAPTAGGGGGGSAMACESEDPCVVAMTDGNLDEVRLVAFSTVGVGCLTVFCLGVLVVASVRR